ncbi:MAG TPA: PadR family transcriptional regulator [Gemmatimonadaceae bacterium]|nr:PadR family transcriptional regulator [Gemmatimonadaceae bacterium]
MPRTPPELLQGTVDILILRAVAWKPMHGYTISQWIGERSRDVLAIEGAALYQALHRLERRKFVSSYWGASENNRKAKFYELTPRGRAELRAEAETWRSYADAVTRVLGTT